MMMFGALLACAGNAIETSVEFQRNPIGIELFAPRFSWKNLSNDWNVQQPFYRIRIARSESDLEHSRHLVWDSEKVNSTDSHLIAYTGPELNPNCTYWWGLSIPENG